MFAIIVHFNIQKLKNKHTFIQTEKAKSSHFDRTRGDKNQIFPTIEMIDSAEKIMNSGLNVFGKEYTHLKPILSNRCAVLAEIPFLKFDGMNLSNSPHKRRITKINEIKKTSILALVDNSLELCRLSYKNENYNLAYKQLASLQHVGQNCKNQQQLLLDEKTYQIIDDKVEYEKSMLFWSWGEKESAKMQMAHLIKKITKYGSEILPEALRVMGSWLWTLKSEGTVNFRFKEVFGNSKKLS